MGKSQATVICHSANAAERRLAHRLVEKISTPRSNRRSSTFRSDRGYFTYIVPSRRITSGHELKQRIRLGGLARDLRPIAADYQRPLRAATLVLQCLVGVNLTSLISSAWCCQTNAHFSPIGASGSLMGGFS